MEEDGEAGFGVGQSQRRADPRRGGAYDGKAEPAAVGRMAVAEADEPLQGAVAVGGGDAGSVVAHGEIDAAVGVADRDGDGAAAPVVADAIVDEVAKDLDQQGAVASRIDKD